MSNLLENELAEAVIAKQEIADKYDKFRLLEGEDDPWGRLDLALLLENQRLFNEDQDDFYQAQFKRISIPLVIRIWKSLVARELISVQPLFKTKGGCYHLEYDENNNAEMHKTEVKANDWKMKVVWSLEGAQDLRSVNNLDAEAELT